MTLRAISSVLIPATLFLQTRFRLISCFWIFYFSIIFFLGRSNFEDGLSLAALCLVVIFKFTPALFAIDYLENLSFNLVVFVLLCLNFTLNIIFLPEVIEDRSLFWLPSFSLGNSTNYINVLGLVAIRLISLRKRDNWNILIVMLVLYYSYTWDNRSGIILACIGLILGLGKNVLFFIFITILGSNLIEFEGIADNRLLSHGLESVRWLVWNDAIKAISEGQYFYGGFSSTYNDTIWMHNIWLDIYRLNGVPSFLLSVILVGVIPVILALRYDYTLLQVLLPTLLIAGSSVPLEGSFLEMLFVVGGIISVYKSKVRLRVFEVPLKFSN